MTELIGQIMNISCNKAGEYKVYFWICPKDELILLQEIYNGQRNSITIHENIYSMIIRRNAEEFDMEPDDRLGECMEVYHEFEYNDNLNPTHRRKWKTAYLADNITNCLIQRNILSLWYSEEDYD